MSFSDLATSKYPKTVETFLAQKCVLTSDIDVVNKTAFDSKVGRSGSGTTWCLPAILK